MRALCLVREAIHYRRECYLLGLEAAGFEIVGAIYRPQPDDVLVIWNRYGHFALEADRFEKAGARVLVTENGWLGKHWRGEEWFALSIGHHCGAGEFNAGGSDRWDGWKVKMDPFRHEGERVILGQRGIGPPGIAAPQGWAEHVQSIYGDRIRQHPGQTAAMPIEQDLANAGEVLTWNSGGALKALMLGIPVQYGFDRWIGRSAAARLGAPLVRSEEARLNMFRRLAWGMWTLAEIRSGEPFDRILSSVEV